MINPWISLGIKAWQIGFEAQSVIALRMLRLAAGGARAEAEASRISRRGADDGGSRCYARSQKACRRW
jgi:hypothetical protein